METVHLIGAEDVRTAGYTMQHAADAMKHAANSFDETLERHRRWMDEWLSRFESAIEKANSALDATSPARAKPTSATLDTARRV